MRNAILAALLIFLSIVPVKAESYCVMSGNDGAIQEEKGMHEKQSVASISKVMTALVAIEQGNLEDRWKVSDAILKVDGSSIYLKVGEEVSLKSLLYGLMLRSGNDAAVEIAQHISGSQEAFVEAMNAKAQAIGMKDTLFHNPSGLDEEDGGNISSAYDMALLMKTAMENETFAEIAGAKYYDNEQKIRWKNKNKLLFTYDATTGGKTGFTKKAGRTLISSAEKDGVSSIVVTFGVGDDFTFHEQAHEKQFAQSISYVILKEGTYQIHGYAITIPASLSVSLNKDGSDHVAVATSLQDGTLTITVTKNEAVQTYTYEGKQE